MKMDFEADSDQFINWLKARQGVTINNKIALVDLRAVGAGRGVVATADIEADEVLFEIPRSIVLCVENSDLPKKLPGVLDDLDTWLSLIVVLIYEDLKKTDSFWLPYLRILPHRFDTLMFWSEAELAELQGSAVVSKIGKDEADETFREHVLPIIRSHPELFPHPRGITSYEGASGQAAVSAMAHRMATLIMAYVFDLEKDESMKQVDEEGFMSDDDEDDLPKGMVPLADMLNADAEKNNARLFYGKNSLVMAALKPIKNGEQIWNDYGPLPRSDLLRRYGYVTENYARYDVVELSTEMMIDVATRSRSMTSEELDARLQHLNNEFTLEDSYELTHPWTTQSAFPRELLLLLRALTSEQRQVSLKSVSTQHLESLMTREVAHMMREIVIEKQKVYSTTAAQDRALLQDTSVRGLLRMAIEVRLGEKLILEEALEEIGGLQLSAPGDADDSANSESKKRRAEQNTEGLLKRKKV